MFSDQIRSVFIIIIEWWEEEWMIGGNSGNIINESDPRTQRFYDQIGKEVESYLLPTATFFEREEQIKGIRDANRSVLKPYPFLMITRRELVSMLENI